LQPNPPEPDAAVREVHLSRTRTLTLIFEALSQSGTEYMNDLAWRNLHFYGSFSDGRDLAVPEPLADTALVWRMDQQRELHVFSLPAMWVELLEWLRERRTATLGEWVEELASRVEGMLSEVTIQELLDAVAEVAGVECSFEPRLAGRVRDGINRNHPASESNIHIALLDGSLEDPAERVGAALWLSLVLYARTRDWPSEGPVAADLAAVGGPRHWSVESYFREVDRRRNSSALGFLAWLYQNLVRQHLSVAMSKLPLDTFMLLYEDGALHYRASDQLPSLSDRYGIMLDVSWDLGWAIEIPDAIKLTDLGERSRAEALRMLS